MSSSVFNREMPASAPRIHRAVSRKRVALAGAALTVLAAACWFGLDWWRNGRFIQSTDDSYVGGDVTTIAPHEGGFIAAVLVRDNQFVHAGQVLVRLDARDYQASLGHAEAVVAGRRAALDSLRAQLALQQSAIAQQAAELGARSAQAAYAAVDAERYRTLSVSADGSRQDAQRTRALNQQAQAAMASATAALQAARQKVPVLAAGIAEAEAALAQAGFDLQTARLDVGYTEIASPIDGYVGNRVAQIGAYAAQAGTLLSVVPARGLWVDANFKEDQLAGMAAGRRATVVADVLPGHVFHGHVVSLSPATGALFSVIPPENATGNFTKIVQRVPVRVLIDTGDDQAGLLRPGLSATVSVDTRP